MKASSNPPNARLPVGWPLLGVSLVLLGWITLTPHQELALSMPQLSLLLGLSALVCLGTWVLIHTLQASGQAAHLR
jgi:hypothetical protein